MSEVKPPISEPTPTPEKKTTKPKGSGSGGKRAGSGRPKDGINRREKVAALAVLDFYYGDLTKAARATGYRETAFKTWMKELGQEIEKYDYPEQIADIKLATNQLLIRFLESLLSQFLLRSSEATFKELYVTLGVVADKLLSTQRPRFIQAHRDVEIPADVPDPKVPQFPREVVPDPARNKTSVEDALDDEQRRYWASILEDVMNQAEAEAEAAGVDAPARNEVVEKLIKENPDAKKYLFFDSMVESDHEN